MRFRSTPPDVPEDDPFANDALDRKGQVDALSRLVESIEGPCVLALDGAWGSGKTVFLKMWASVLRAQGFEVVEFNAWETDFSDDPLMALQAEINATLEGKPNYKALAKAGMTVMSSLTSFFWPVPDMVKTYDDIRNQMETSTQLRLNRYRAARGDIAHFQQTLSRTVGAGGRLVVCVDELDRCRPDYAIRFLEATKHIFEVDGVIFLLAVNLSELANSVRALYGAGFDAHQYLRRFVDQVLHLQTDRSRYLNHLIDSTGLDRRINNPHVAIEGYLETFLLRVPNLSLRDLEQATRHLRLVLSSLPYWYWDMALSMMIIRIVIPDTYRQFISGVISDLEVLAVLNRCINRSDEWWRSEIEPVSINRANVSMETTLICWGLFISGSDKTPSPLWGKRTSEMPQDESETNYASMVVSDLEPIRHRGIRMHWDGIAKIMAIMEMITYDPPGDANT